MMDDNLLAIVFATFVAVSAMCATSPSTTSQYAHNVHIAAIW